MDDISSLTAPYIVALCHLSRIDLMQENRKRARRANPVIIVPIFLVVVSSSIANAQDEASSSDTAAARELAVEGLKLADAGQCTQAIDRLTRAEKLHHSPIVLDRLGECLIAEGKIVAGTEDLRKLLREALPENPSPNVVRARERAQIALDAAKLNIGILTISVQGPTENVTVKVDGQLVPSALFDRDRPTDPGEHDLEAACPGYLSESRHVTLGPGAKQAVQFNLRKDPAAVSSPNLSPTGPSNAITPTPGAPKSAPPHTTTGAMSARQDTSPNRTGSTIFWILGGAAVSAGSAFGFIALSEKKELDKQCGHNSCPQSSKVALDTANRNATLSTIFVGVGAASLALGTVLYFTSATKPTTEKSLASTRPRAWVGLGRIGVEGEF